MVGSILAATTVKRRGAAAGGEIEGALLLYDAVARDGYAVTGAEAALDVGLVQLGRDSPRLDLAVDRDDGLFGGGVGPGGGG